MKRRDFLQTTLAASCVPLGALSSGVLAADDPSRQFYEWCRYVISDDAQHQIVSDFLQNAALPALGRLNIGPIGVFTEMGDDASLAIHTLVPFNSVEQMLSVGPGLAADEEFHSAASDYLSVDKDHPAYDRKENQLMVAFHGFPQIKTPRTGERIFELRVYESHSELKARRKIEMFNEAEFSIFRKVGLDGVFFGETLIGSNLPNLTYMLAYTDMADHDRAWDAFRNDPDWHQLRDVARYQDTVSKIVSQYLRPKDYSQI